jgi:curved DNA-binding protein CbpA
MSKDYYRVLGVLDDAEDIVIKAAYKALAQRYHPDKWAGDSAEANRRMAEINEAYGVLSDSVKRKEYDSQREKATYQAEPEGDDLNPSVEVDWNKVIEYFPDLVGIAAGLAALSPFLVYSYKVILLDTKNFNDRQVLADRLEDHYFEKYFGSNSDIRRFAKRLITVGNRSAAKELNEAINLLGSQIDPSIIIERIKKKYQISFDSPKEKSVAKSLQIIENQFDLESYQTFQEAWSILLVLGYEPRDKGWLITTSYAIVDKSKTRELSRSEFVAFAIEVGERYLLGIS